MQQKFVAGILLTILVVQVEQLVQCDCLHVCIVTFELTDILCIIFLNGQASHQWPMLFTTDSIKI